ncbi:aminoglycoside phosphotransferase (APT) family kinase protein [Arthrobacter sp. UYP6]|uniref:phosphotransferase n=1 Tax=Arthrobacter sp. UYP6 TaxID=1756378 RepID=UPI003395499C
MQQLAEAGFVPPARFAVTRERGWSATHRTLVTDLADGSNWAHWLQAPTISRNTAAVAAADWLARLQSLQVTLPDRTAHRAGDELCRQGGLLAERYPVYAARLLRVTEAAHRCLYLRGHAPVAGLVASHGDLHPENLYISAGGRLAVTAIDVDTAGMRRASYDVGYALAQLLIVSWMRTGSFQAGVCVALTFWDRWMTHGGTDARAVPAEVVRALVQSLHFELITYRTGRAGLVQRWLGIAEAMLDHGVRAALQVLTTEQDVRS